MSDSPKLSNGNGAVGFVHTFQPEFPQSQDSKKAPCQLTSRSGGRVDTNFFRGQSDEFVEMLQSVAYA